MTKKVHERPRADESRRQFVKKAVYSAPALIALGLLSSPSNASRKERSRVESDCDPFNDPNCNPPSGPNSFNEEQGLDITTEQEKWV